MPMDISMGQGQRSYKYNGKEYIFSLYPRPDLPCLSCKRPQSNVRNSLLATPVRPGMMKNGGGHKPGKTSWQRSFDNLNAQK